MRGIDSPTVAAAEARLQTLSELLDRYRPLWQERSFHRLQPEWGRQWPELLAALDALPLATAEALQQRRSEEHTSELQSRGHLVCRLLLEKKKNNKQAIYEE